MRGGMEVDAVMSDVLEIERLSRSRYRFSRSPPAAKPQVARLDGATAITIARERFHKLCAEGTLSTTAEPVEIDPSQVEIVLGLLRHVGKTQTLGICAIDIQRDIETSGHHVTKGAVIAAAVAAGFTLRTWRGVWDYGPDALINASSRDLRRAITAVPLKSER